MKTTLSLTAGAAALLMAGLFATAASASTPPIVVTPTDTQGWSTNDTRPGGTVNFVADSTAPAGTGALQLTTDGTTAAKAQYIHSASSTPLSSVTELSYYTKQNSASFAQGAPSYQMEAFLSGTTTGYTTLVYEPYYNGTVATGTWQYWDVAAGKFWSSHTITCANGTVNGSAGGPATYTLSDLKALCPDAVVLSYGVNVGTYNPSYDVETDLFDFNGTTYNFEVTAPDTTAPPAPTPVSPANGATTTTANLTKVDWTDVTDPSGPVTYIYQAANSPATTTDGSFVSPVYTSGPLTASEIPTPNTPAGTYYWHVTATDAAGNVSPWSVTWMFTVDNTPLPPPPTQPTTMDDCKNGGWKTFSNPSYKNQGQCVSSVASKNK